MDTQAIKKALFRAKMKEHDEKKSKRINSPLIRYNDLDQPVCRVCDFILKSESSWQAHQVSRKHHEAINSLKEKARGEGQPAVQAQIKNVKSEHRFETTKPDPVHSIHLDRTEPVKYIEIPRALQSSNIPANFFDDNHPKRQKTDQQGCEPNLGIDEPELSDASERAQPHPRDSTEVAFPSKGTVGWENGEGKNGLPEGFFDNKDADLRARGIRPVKPDIKDEYKEYEKSIQQDIQEVDDRLEEEEYDAADVIEEAEFVEQRAYKEKVEALRNKWLEAKASVVSGCNGGEERTEESSSIDDDSDQDSGFAVDWRAKHL